MGQSKIGAENRRTLQSYFKMIKVTPGPYLSSQSGALLDAGRRASLHLPTELVMPL